MITRFAPSPTGGLHLGHAFSALFAASEARRGHGQFLLRIEDIDSSRCRPEYIAGIFDDLAWLGLRWPMPVRRQSEHWEEYRAALQHLAARDLLYPCFCTRSEIAREIAAAGAAPHGPDGPLYPGTCRTLSAAEREDRIAAGQPFALRLNIGKALQQTGPLRWLDRDAGLQQADPACFGDVVLARKDVPASYHLAVVVDDAVQGVTLVTRGLDLFPASHLHRLLQALLGLPVPEWRHHPLLLDEQGQRFAKRNRAVTLRSLRDAGHSPQAVRRMAGLTD